MAKHMQPHQPELALETSNIKLEISDGKNEISSLLGECINGIYLVIPGHVQHNYKVFHLGQGRSNVCNLIPKIIARLFL